MKPNLKFVPSFQASQYSVKQKKPTQEVADPPKKDKNAKTKVEAVPKDEDEVNYDNCKDMVRPSMH